MPLPLRRLLLATPLLLAACTASSPQPQPPSATASAAPEPTSDPTDINFPGDRPPSASAGSTATPAAPAQPDTPPGSTITNEPPAGGRVVANAGSTGGSDRMQAMMDLIKDKRDGFRKCFDLWGKKNPGQSGKIAFQFFLKPDGTLEKAAFKADEGDIHAAEVETCMITFAKTLTYPASSVGKDTIYTHRFEFKAAPK